jgi:hypothetical protein
MEPVLFSETSLIYLGRGATFSEVSFFIFTAARTSLPASVLSVCLLTYFLLTDLYVSLGPLPFSVGMYASGVFS